MTAGQPLAGRQVVVTRATSAAAAATRLFNAAGASVIELPALTIDPPDDWGPLDGALVTLADFDWLIFSSVNGVAAVEQRLERLQQQRPPTGGKPRIAAVGRATALALQQRGWSVDFIPPHYVADSLLLHFPQPVEHLRLLLPRVQTGGRDLLARQFRAQGATVVEVPAYESRCPRSLPTAAAEALDQGRVAAITFSSSKTVQHSVALLSQRFGDGWLQRLQPVKVISIGPQTSAACRKRLGRVDAEANPHDLDGLVAATCRVFNTPCPQDLPEGLEPEALKP